LRQFLLIVFTCTLLPAQSFTITQAWDRVLNVDESLQATKIGIKRSQKIKEAASSLNLPTISLNASYTHLDKPVEMELPLSQLPIPLEDMNLKLTNQDIALANVNMRWALYTGGKITAAQKIRSLQANEESAKYSLSEDKAFLKLMKYYYGVLMSEELLQTRIEVEHALNTHLSHAQKLKEQGQIANVELLNAKVKLSDANLETRKAHHSKKIAQSALKTLLHVESIVLDSKLFIHPLTKEYKHYEDETLLNFSGLKFLDSKMAQSKEAVSLQSAAYLPTVVAYGNYSLYKDDSLTSDLLPNWFAGAMINIDLLDSKGRSEKVDAAKLLHKQVQLLKEEASKNLKVLVEKLYLELQSYQDEYYALDTTLALAKENVKMRNLAFDEGLSTSLEVIDAELFLASIKTKKANASYNYILKLSELSTLSSKQQEFFSFATMETK